MRDQNASNGGVIAIVKRMYGAAYQVMQFRLDSHAHTLLRLDESVPLLFEGAGRYLPSDTVSTSLLHSGMGIPS